MKWLKCSKCCQKKPENDFYKSTASPTGYRPDCKICFKLSVNKDNRRAYEKEYRQKNLARRSAIVRRSMKKNEEHHKDVRRAYLASPEGLAAHRRHGQTRVAREKNAFVEVVCPREVYASQSGECYLCSAVRAFSEMHLDHVIPLARGGKHERTNCKMACAVCNLRKGSKTPEELSYQMV